MDFEGFPQEGDRIMQSESKMQVLGIYRVYLPGNLLTRKKERERERRVGKWGRKTMSTTPIKKVGLKSGAEIYLKKGLEF